MEITLEKLTEIVRNSWDDSPVTDNPALGSCIETALIVQDYFGGELLYADFSSELQEILGSICLCHCWNKLPNGEEVDLSIDQFPHEKRGLIPAGRVVNRQDFISDKENDLDPCSVRSKYIRLSNRVAQYLVRDPAQLGQPA